MLTKNIPRWLATGTGLIHLPPGATGPDVFCKLADAESAAAAATAHLLAQIAKAEHAASALADQYLSLSDAMGYTSGKDGLEFSPEEYAEKLVARIAELEANAHTEIVRLRTENAELEAKLAQRVPDERAAFEKWFEPYWEGRQSDLAPWAGWQARAALAAAHAAPEQQEPSHPQFIAGFKAGHAAGRIRGAASVARASNAQQAEAQEPCAWLDDFGNAFPLGANKGAGSWMDAHKRNWRPLFTRPQPAQLQALSEEEVREALLGFSEDSSTYEDNIDGLAKCIQSALAAKNGMNLK